MEPSKIGLVIAFAGALVACGDDGSEPSTTEGPGAALKCTSSGKNAFDTYGATAFVAVNEEIFSLVTAELEANGPTNVGGSFSTVTNFPKFKGRLAAFLVFVYGGPPKITYTDNVEYEGNTQNMAEAHAGMAITGAQYDYFVTNVIVPALANKGVPADDISSCFAPIVLDAKFKASITEDD